MAVLDSDSDLVDSSGEEEEEINDNHMDNQQVTDAVNPSAIELESLNPGANNDSQDVESASETDCTSAGVIDLIAIAAGILLWLTDIVTDIWVIRTAYTKYHFIYALYLSIFLVISITATYAVDWFTVMKTLRMNKRSLFSWTIIPRLLFGPLGRYFSLNHMCMVVP